MHPNTFIHYMDRYCVYIIHLLFFIPKNPYMSFSTITSIKKITKNYGRGCFRPCGLRSPTPDLVTISHGRQASEKLQKKLRKNSRSEAASSVPSVEREDSGFVGTLGRGWKGKDGLPSRKLTYPTWGKGKSSSNMPYKGDMLIPWRVGGFRYFSFLYPI